MNFMSFNQTIETLKKIKDIYHIDKVDIGALEPFLYRDGKKDIVDLIKAIEKLSLEVKITTNGSLLHKYINKLTETNIKKIRVSLHSMDRDIFSTISNSQVNLDLILNSIIEAKKQNLPVEINSLIFKNYENQIRKIINFCLKYDINLKLYNLYYSPYYRKDYEKYYVASEDIVEFITNNFNNYKIIQEENLNKRKRTILKIKNVQFVIKEDRDINRNNKYCQSCEYINECGEQFAEYIRVDPDFKFYPCYLRKDLKFDLLDNKILSSLNKFNKEINIRLIVSPICNFKCSFPDKENNFWCLKQGGDYQWQGTKCL